MSARIAAATLLVVLASCSSPPQRTLPPAVIAIDGDDTVIDGPTPLVSDGQTDVGLVAVPADRLRSVAAAADAVPGSHRPPIEAGTEVRVPDGCGSSRRTSVESSSSIGRPTPPGRIAAVADQVVVGLSPLVAADVHSTLDQLASECALDIGPLLDHLTPTDTVETADPITHSVLAVEPIALSAGSAWLLDTSSPAGPHRLVIAVAGHDLTVIVLARPGDGDDDRHLLAAMVELSLLRGGAPLPDA